MRFLHPLLGLIIIAIGLHSTGLLRFDHFVLEIERGLRRLFGH